jgi:hypothetical protein
MTNETTAATMPPTPELDKQSEIIKSGRAATVQEFIDWMLDEKRYQLAEYLYESTESCLGARRDPFDESNCEDGTVKRTCTLWIGSKRVGRVEEGQTCPECAGTGEVTVTFRDPKLVPILTAREQLMADFFGIDLRTIDTERRALLDTIRSNA